MSPKIANKKKKRRNRDMGRFGEERWNVVEDIINHVSSMDDRKTKKDVRPQEDFYLFLGV